MKAKRYTVLITAVLFLFIKCTGQNSLWRLYISNDVCLDYTWSLTEMQTKDYAADLIAAHLDAMNTSDNQPWQNKARYTCTVTNEIFFFLEKYPQRYNELVNRIREGRILLSPFLANNIWGFTGVEGFLRSIYPAKRFAVANNLPLVHAVHSELPSLPWGIVPLLSGSGIRWINKPYYDYDATFSRLNNAPIFKLFGPDSSKINVLMDKYACRQYHYMQGAGALKIHWYEKDTLSIENFWLPHYSNLPNYPLKAILAEGTHGDLSAGSQAQVPSITQKIIDYNNQFVKSVTMVNATFSMFADLVDSIEAIKHFIPGLQGSFGHSWELWPLCMAKYAANLRQGENKLVASEALLASANIDFKVNNKLLEMHHRAEWLIGMLADHAWNGSDSSNIITNETIRKRFSEELITLTDSVTKIGFTANGVKQMPNTLTIYNPTCYKRSSMVEVFLPNKSKEMSIWSNNKKLNSQLVVRNGAKSLCFMTDTLPGYSFSSYKLKPGKISVSKNKTQYNTILNNKTGIDIFNSQTSEIEVSLQLKYLSDTSYYAKMQESKIISDGSIATIYQVTGQLPETRFTIELIFYKSNSTIDLKISLNKKISTSKEGIYLICKFQEKALLHVETTAAVVRPFFAPKGDYLPGADTTRMVMQGFANAEFVNDGGLILASPDAFCLTPSDTAFVIQLLGNNHNYRESIKDQNCETDFNYRFSLIPYTGGYSPVQSHNVGFINQMPLLVTEGEIAAKKPLFYISNPNIKVTTCKPADPAFGDGVILRLWNTSPCNTNALIHTNDFKKAWLTDLLEQDIKLLDSGNGLVSIPVHGNGFAGVRFVKE
jgi:hypothetical protein